MPKYSDQKYRSCLVIDAESFPSKHSTPSSRFAVRSTRPSSSVKLHILIPMSTLKGLMEKGVYAFPLSAIGRPESLCMDSLNQTTVCLMILDREFKIFHDIIGIKIKVKNSCIF